MDWRQFTVSHFFNFEHFDETVSSTTLDVQLGDDRLFGRSGDGLVKAAE